MVTIHTTETRALITPRRLMEEVVAVTEVEAMVVAAAEEVYLRNEDAKLFFSL